MKSTLDAFFCDKWKQDFVTRANVIKAELDLAWEPAWQTKCSGKKLIDDLYRKYEISFSKVEFKKEIIKAMADGSTDDWRALNGLLAAALF